MTIRVFSFFALILLFTSCDPIYTISYQVENASVDSITVVFNIDMGVMDTIGIASDKSAELFGDFGIGMTSRRFLNQLEDLPLEVIRIEQDGLLYQGNPNDFEIWDKKAAGDTEPSRVVLMVRDEDFN